MEDEERRAAEQKIVTDKLYAQQFVHRMLLVELWVAFLGDGPESNDMARRYSTKFIKQLMRLTDERGGMDTFTTAALDEGEGIWRDILRFTAGGLGAKPPAID